MIRPLYKAQEPFMEMKHGHGYQGVLMFDDLNNKCQCHVCGKWFVSIGQHSFFRHKLSSDDYKMRFGFTLKTALCGTALSAIKSKHATASYKRGLLKIDDLTRRNRMRHKRGFKKQRQTGLDSPQKRNEHGLCDAQILARYEVVKRIVGRDPSEGDYLRYDKKLYFSGIMGRYRNLNNFRRKILKLIPKTGQDFTRFLKLDLIAKLRKVAKVKGDTPTSKDMKLHRYGPCPTSMTYLRHFGSWQQALCASGLR